MKNSKYQEAIYTFAQEDTGSGAINAVAGSGKTTTGVQLCKIFDNQLAYGRFMAFNKHIKIELAERARSAGITGFDFLTYNGFGNGVLMRGLRVKPRLNENKDRNLLLYKVAQNDPVVGRWAGTIVRLISLFKNMAFMDVDSAITALPEIATRHDIDLPGEAAFTDYLIATFRLSITTHNVISFDDQKYLPLYLEMDIPSCEVLVIDEYQDTCLIESELVLRGCPDGRVFVFGDPDQCIYSFKGTTPDAMKMFMSMRNAVELPLSVCYRCPISVVKEAQKYVPRIEWAEGAAEGVVDQISKSRFLEQAEQGDMVLSRLTVDAVESCLSMIRRGKRAYVQGRDIGMDLIGLIDKVVGTGDLPIYDFMKVLEIYRSEQTARLSAAGAESRLANLEDKLDTIRVLAESCDSVQGIRVRINEIFPENPDEGGGVAHMTIHKAKGLECSGIVYLLAPEKIPHKRAKQDWQIAEEFRLMYVAITRAKKRFYYVTK